MKGLYGGPEISAMRNGFYRYSSLYRLEAYLLHIIRASTLFITSCHDNRSTAYWMLSVSWSKLVTMFHFYDNVSIVKLFRRVSYGRKTHLEAHFF